MEFEAMENKADILSLSANHVEERRGVTLPIFLLVLYFIVEYGRPSFLSPIKPGLLVQIMLVLCLIPHQKKVIQIFKEKFFRLYLILLVFMAIHVFIATNNYWAFMYLRVMITYLIIGLSFCVFIDNIRKMNTLLSFYVLLMVFCAIDRIMGGGGLRGSGFIGASGYMGDENDFALAMNVVLPISIFLGRAQEEKMKLFFWSASVLFVLANMVSSSRGGFVGLVAVGAVCWLYSKHKLRALPVIAAVAVLAWTFATPVGKEKIMGLGFDSVKKDTGKDRIELWKVGWKAFIDNPILGVGQGNMPIVMSKYQYDKWGESAFSRDIWGRAVHSVYLTLLPELGFVGLTLFGLMLKDLVVRYKKIKELCKNSALNEEARKVENLNIALLVSLFGFLATGIFLSAFYYPQFWNVSALLVTLFMISSQSLKGQEPNTLEKMNL